MKHRQTRRKGRSIKHRVTRRKQHGGAASSVKDWFDAVSAFEKDKNITSEYPLESLKDPSLVLPPIEPGMKDNTDFEIAGVPVNSKEPTFTRFDIRIMSAILNQILDPVIRSGYNTPEKFDLFIKQIRNSPDENDPNKETVNFLNEIEVALQKKAADTTSNISVLNRNGRTLYIWYLAMNPTQGVAETPLTTTLPKEYADMLNLLSAPTQGAPAVPTV